MSGMKNINFKYLYRRTEQLLMVPETVWPEALNETNSGKELYRNYLIPITMVISIMVLLINLINYNFWQATGLTIINLIAMLIGNWFAYLITREYLCRKLSFDTNLALNLTVYSGVIFIIFHICCRILPQAGANCPFHQPKMSIFACFGESAFNYNMNYPKAL